MNPARRADRLKLANTVEQDGGHYHADHGRPRPSSSVTRVLTHVNEPTAMRMTPAYLAYLRRRGLVGEQPAVRRRPRARVARRRAAVAGPLSPLAPVRPPRPRPDPLVAPPP